MRLCACYSDIILVQVTDKLDLAGNEVGRIRDAGVESNLQGTYVQSLPSHKATIDAFADIFRWVLWCADLVY